MKRTHNATDIGMGQVGEQVTLNGWVNARRDQGGLIFIDLRDGSGFSQVVFNPELERGNFHCGRDVGGGDGVGGGVPGNFLGWLWEFEPQEFPPPSSANGERQRLDKAGKGGTRSAWHHRLKKWVE